MQVDVTREWQRELVEQIDSITESLPNFEPQAQASPKAAAVAVQQQPIIIKPYMIGVAFFIVSIIVLITVRPSFLERTEQDRFYENKSFNYPLAILLAAGLAVLVAFLNLDKLYELLKGI